MSGEETGEEVQARMAMERPVRLGKKRAEWEREPRQGWRRGRLRTQ